MIRRTFIDNNCKTFLQLYQSLVRPKLEYCVQSWRPYLKKDIDYDGKVQKRATRLMVKDRSVCYEDRLRMLGLTTLETRRFLGDLIEFLIFLKNFIMLHIEIFIARHHPAADARY